MNKAFEFIKYDDFFMLKKTKTMYSECIFKHLQNFLEALFKNLFILTYPNWMLAICSGILTRSWPFEMQSQMKSKAPRPS